MKKIHQSLARFVNSLQSTGRYTFTRAEAAKTLALKSNALTKSLQRLSHSRRICQVQRGFYVIVPIEYESSGAPPVDWFVGNLMEHIGHPYYVGVMTAALLHGAAHQRPQEYHVVTPVSHRTIQGDSFRIRFFRHANAKQVRTEARQTYTNYIPVSTPEFTALDLTRFSKSIGGLDAVLTILSELGERIDSNLLLVAAQTERVMGVVQRTGWLLDRAGWDKHTSGLAAWLARQRPSRTVLNSALPSRQGQVCKKWLIIENDQPKGEL